jgi:FkbM family methyltransferase
VININKTLNETAILSEQTIKLVLEFLSNNSSKKRYILGKNSSAKQLINTCQHIKFDGIIDDFDKNITWENLPILRGNSVQNSSIIVNCSTSISPVSAHRYLHGLGLSILKYSDICTYLKELPQHDFVEEFRSEIKKHEIFWIKLGRLLKDQVSKKTLSDIMKFRLTGNYMFMENYTVRLKEQYFDSIIQTTNQEIFVDCGGFDGDTTLEFIKKYPNYLKIFFFEPSELNFTRASENLKDFKNVCLLPLGVSDKKDTLLFNHNNGSTCSISTSGSSKIDVVTIDETVNEKITFIKMDLEGWELKALQGAKKHILENHPKLAISTYHNAADFRKVPEFILSLRDDYDLYLRHYSEGWSETVMYFIPK